MNNCWKVYCDGGSRGNPGPAAAAFVVEEKGRIIEQKGVYLGKATNNAAEYGAAVEALRWLKEKGSQVPPEIIFVHDSELIARQLSGRYKIKNENLRSLYATAKSMEKEIPASIVYTTVKRENNKNADFLVNKILDENR